MGFHPRIVQCRRGTRLVHPGEILLEEWILPCGLSQNSLARRMGVPPRRINEIVLGKRSITADTAIGLAAALGTTEHYWMALQSDYELEIARARRERRDLAWWRPQTPRELIEE